MDADQFLADLPDLTSILGNDEDAIQDISLRCWRCRATIQDLPRYARRAAANRRTDGARRRARNPASLPADVLLTLWDPKPTPLDRLVQAETVRGILGDLGQLPERQREAVGAVVLNGEPIAEAAARLGRTPGAVRSDVWRGRQALMDGINSGN